jgi:hypothetical protein
MSVKTSILAATALAVSAVMVLPATAAEGNDKPDRPVPFRATIMFNLLDRNSDGAVDLQELDVLQAAIFTAIDRDSDGKLTKEEFAAVARGMGPRGMHRGPGGRGPGGPGGPGDHGPDRHGSLEDPHGGPGGGPDRMGFDDGQGPDGPRFAAIDGDQDGSVSRSEFDATRDILRGMLIGE